MSIVKAIKDWRGRFLKRGKNSEWVEVNDEEAREAISKRLRTKPQRPARVADDSERAVMEEVNKGYQRASAYEGSGKRHKGW